MIAEQCNWSDGSDILVVDLRFSDGDLGAEEGEVHGKSADGMV